MNPHTPSSLKDDDDNNAAKRTPSSVAASPQPPPTFQAALPFRTLPSSKQRIPNHHQATLPFRTAKQQSPNNQLTITNTPNMSTHTPSADDVSMIEVMTPPPIPEEKKDEAEELKYGPDAYTRFELELEFVQCLANPTYLSHLANSTNPPYFSDPSFINYLEYLQYWSHPSYAKYLHYPGPTLKNLELLQLESFRRDIGRPEVVARMVAEGVVAGLRGPGSAGVGGSGGGVGEDGVGLGQGQGKSGSGSGSGQGTPNPS